MCTMLEPERRFYNDLPKEEQDHWTSELKPSPTGPQFIPISHAAYLHYPVTYLFCERDEVLPLGIQQMMVQKVTERAGISIETETCTAGHSPFLSQPETVLNLVKITA